MTRHAKILIINDGIVCKEGMSGSDRRAMHWSQIFSESHKVFVMVPEFAKQRFTKTSQCYCINVKESSVGIIDYLYRVYLGIRKIINLKKDKLDVVYSSSDLIPDSIPAIVFKLMSPNTKWISGLHLIAPSPFKGFTNAYTKTGIKLPSLKGLYYYLTQTVIIFFMRKLAHLVFVSNEQDRLFLLNKKGFTENQVLVTYGAPEWNEINKIEIEKIVKQYDLCFIARFHPQKGYDDLLKAWGLILKNIEKAKLVIIGDIPVKILTEKLKQININETTIDYLGFLDGVEKYHKIAQSKILLFPSYYESFGMVAVEAQACGVPVIAYDLPFFKTIYPKGMIRVEIGATETLAEKIILLLENELLRNKIAKEARENAERFNFRYTATEILERLK
jgi:glycosyltransferase involved in cell wall biosynthesis